MLGRDFLEDKNVVLILGDNLFYGNNFENNLIDANKDKDCATVFAYPVSDPSRYGIFYFEKNTNNVIDIIEKPKNPTSNFAMTGLYFYDKYSISKFIRLGAQIGVSVYFVIDMSSAYIYNLNLDRSLCVNSFLL